MTMIDERNLTAMDLTAVMVVCDLADGAERDVADLLPAFLQSQTAELLYDDSLKYWWDGPAVLEDMFKAEIAAGGCR